MAEQVLFQDASGQLVTQSTLRAALEACGAADADVLFIHSDLTFGQPNLSLGRRGIMAGVLDAVRSLGVGTLIVPTFTFSFPNGRDYDVQKSKTKMGAFNEYFRRQPEAVRSLDPMMSVAAMGEKRYLATDVGHESIGKGCTFDLLHQEARVKFLFLGVRPAMCFTYTHYIEYALHVPYRYNRAFTGKVTAADGTTREETYELFVRYAGVEPTDRDDFEQALLHTGAAKKVSCGDSFLYVVEEKASYALLVEKIRLDPLYMLAHDYPRPLDDRFEVTGEMVAL